MKRMWKGFYLSSPIVSGIVFLVVSIAILVLVNRPRGRDADAAILTILLCSLPLTYAGVVNLIFIYKIWQAIQNGQARTTPGKAVGFMFIPIFNLFWIFQVFWGFAKDYNAYVDQHSIDGKKLSEGLFLACPILLLFSGVPLVGIVSAVVLAITISKTCDAINSVVEADAISGQTGTPLSLYFLSGEFANDSLELPPSGLTIGRDPSTANLIFKSQKISALHAKLTPNGQGQVWAEDMNSLNGTFYRQQRVGGQNLAWDWVRLKGQTLLAPGARLRLADDVSEFEIRKP